VKEANLMKTLHSLQSKAAFTAGSFAIGLVAFAGMALAQTQTEQQVRDGTGGPAFATFPNGPEAQAAPPQGQYPPSPYPPPPYPQGQQAPYQQAPNQQAPNQQGQPPAFAQGQQQPYGQPPVDFPTVPAHLTLPQGTFVTVRVNQWLSSDRNQQGDAFFATLADPVVVDGVVIAQRGQNVSGRVTEATKAGMAKGVSHLGLQLTELTLVDGQQIGIQSQVATRNGPTSVGRDVNAVGGTSALGAVAGAVAGGGVGAGIGAGAGAAAGLIGVLLTRGQPTIVAPETMLTFRIEAPVAISTERAPMAFRYVEAPDYQSAGVAPQSRIAYPAPPPGYAPGYGPGYYGYPSPYYGFGPSVGFYVGPRFGYYRGFGGRGGFRR